uniref:Uncharacterized protein n=1 Tax=Tetraodon nigroviridis TaxID=99883 RepID=H3CZN8_TETNG
MAGIDDGHSMGALEEMDGGIHMPPRRQPGGQGPFGGTTSQMTVCVTSSLSSCLWDALMDGRSLSLKECDH